MSELPVLDRLRDRFGIPGVVDFEEVGQLIRVVVASAGGEAHLYLHGAHVTSWTPRGESPVLFTSMKSSFLRDKAIRGGIPVIFPWFGTRAGDASAAMHGFARVAEWTLRSVSRPDAASVGLELGLETSAATRAIWPGAFSLRYRISVGAALHLALEVQNTSPEPFVFEEALHTYLSVGDVRDVSIDGLAGATYIDKTDGMKRKVQGPEPVRLTGETDRVYLATTAACVVDDASGGRQLVVEKSGSATTVLWNPWIDKAKAMADFAAEEWRTMLCVETGNAADDAVQLAPGERHAMQAVLHVQKR